MRIRPCIDIHDGRVKQIVGGTLSDRGVDAGHEGASLRENFVSAEGASFYASIYRENNLPGGHVILLNSSTDKEMYEADRREALEALRAYPGGMQVGGGITPENAECFLREGASHVIITSYVFRNGKLDRDKLYEIVQAVGREHLTLDLSCRRGNDGQYYVVTDRWQKWTDLKIGRDTLDDLSRYCDEFLIHAADVEGKRGGIEASLTAILGEWQRENKFPVTYAGGIHAVSDLKVIYSVSGGNLDVTVGSALDLFGGELSLNDLIETIGQWECSD